jgi:hypothetical protein
MRWFADDKKAVLDDLKLVLGVPPPSGGESRLLAAQRLEERLENAFGLVSELQMLQRRFRLLLELLESLAELPEVVAGRRTD